MSDKICDHKSAGVLVKKDGRILLIERKKFPAGFALPAGHLDGDEFRKAGLRELAEETGIIAEELKYVLGEEVTNPCRRSGGTSHQWEVFEAVLWKGEVNRAEDETKSVEWASPERLKDLALKTESFAKKHGLLPSNLSALTHALSSDPEWQRSPGLEPVWYHFLRTIAGCGL